MRFLNLAERRREDEVMDQPGLDPAARRRALRGLARINAMSRTVPSLWPLIQKMAVQKQDSPLRVLDIACGGGDVALGLWQQAKRTATPIVLEGCDVSPVAVEHASSRAQQSGAPVRFFTLDVLCDRLPGGYDLMLSCLFLHHLERPAAVGLLRDMAAAAPTVLISDLSRSTGGLIAACCVTHLVTTSSAVHTDGPRSVRAAFTLNEMKALADEAQLRGAKVNGIFPYRFMLWWNRGWSRR